MKKILIYLFIAGAGVACGNDKTTESNGSSPVAPGADNVNGNLPDTTESIRLNQTPPQDSSSLTDSTR